VQEMERADFRTTREETEACVAARFGMVVEQEAEVEGSGWIVIEEMYLFRV
jgi:hypothetical protein